jgi:hypothetical protein
VPTTPQRFWICGSASGLVTVFRPAFLDLSGRFWICEILAEITCGQHLAVKDQAREYLT